MAEFLLPDVGEGLTEAEIVTWHVAEGDTVAINDIICDIETAKSIVELPSPFAGTVQRLMVEVGQMVEVGTPIIAIGDGAAEAPAESAAAPQPPAEIDLSNPAATGGGEGESLVGRTKAERPPTRRRRRGSATPTTEAGANTQMQVQGAFSPGGAQSDAVAASDEPVVPAAAVAPPEPAPVPEWVPARSAGQVRVLAKPPVRKLAKDLGVDLSTLVATGPHGTISRDDVAAAADGGSPTSAVPSSPAPVAARVGAGSGPRETREPVKGVRKMMAQAMSDSAFTAPHVTEWISVDVTATMQLLERLKAHRDFRDLRLSPLVLLARACLLALRRTPIINSSFDAEAQEIVVKHHVNLGIAAATPRGLVVPNVKDADAMDLSELATALAELVGTAREGRTQPAEMAGGTFTITNVGVFGVDAGTPIINPPESAILAFGAVNRRPWVVGSGDEERIEVRDVTTLALSFDHRHVDGEAGSRFLADVAAVLNDPGLALTM